MRRYKVAFDVFFGIEHRLRNNSTDGGLRQMRPESRIKAQAVRIKSTHHEEFLRQFCPSQGMKEGSP